MPITPEIDQLRHAMTQAYDDFGDRDEFASGRGFDLREPHAVTREIPELLRAYRTGTLGPGPDTGDFIEATIMRQSELVAQAREAFPRWLADEQARFDAFLAWVMAANRHAAALAHHDGDSVEARLADALAPAAGETADREIL